MFHRPCFRIFRVAASSREFFRERQNSIFFWRSFRYRVPVLFTALLTLSRAARRRRQRAHAACEAMRFAFLALIATGLTAASFAQPNLLFNGTFNSPLAGTWTTWTTNGGWAGLAPDSARSYNGTPYAQVGGSGGSGKIYQVVSAIPNATYTLSCVSSVQNWWWPHGIMTLSFLDPANNELLAATVDCAATITDYDIGLPWTNYTLSAISPPGTSKARVQFYCAGSGTVFFDNVVLTSFTPTILSARQEASAISVVWSPAPSALSYTLKRSATHGGPYHGRCQRHHRH